jgi:cytochrome b subunit of formate dehydrogenase/nitrate/TMAO reductase-like tetraheme cytochrome c subunit
MRSGVKWALALALAELMLWLTGACPTALAQADDDCLMCHADSELFEDYSGTLHAEAGLQCVDCHQELADSEDFPHAEQLQAPDCSACHDEEQATYLESVHGYASARGNPRAPSCATCHGVHEILPSSDPASPTHRSNLTATCAACHGEAGLLTNELVKFPQPFASYARSVHGNGNGHEPSSVAATCSDCHGVHDLRGAHDPKSRINHANVSATCGRCHAETRDEYDASIHGLALSAGVSDSPTCNDCHGEHLILSATDPDSKTYARQLATQTCGTCHDDPVIIAKYRLQGGVVGSYVDSYHGWATRREYAESASCVSCHTAHAVLPKAHSASTIHPDNVLDTCRKCHQRADVRFAASYTHEAASITANPVNRWIRSIYIGMIIVVVGGMLLHNFVIINYYIVEKRRACAADCTVRRLDRSQLLQHLLLTISFTGLVVTGFALRFPEVTRRGLDELKAIAPSRSDLGQFLNNMLFHTWRRKQHVEFDRYDYTQKAEYWALVWGTLVMVVTGLVLWFPEQAVKLLPSWGIAASQTVHYYEAWLATLAIIVWHFFFVIFHPEAYPMSWTWVTGKMSVESARRHHARWYKEELAGSTPTLPSRERPAKGTKNKPAA